MQQNAGLDLAEMALFDNRQGGQWFRPQGVGGGACGPHSQRATVDYQNHRWRWLLYRGAFAPAVGILPAQGLTVVGRRLS